MNKNITVVGAGTSGYFTVLYLCTKFPNYNIEWIYPEENKTIGVGEATVSSVIDFLEYLGLSKETILRELNGSLKLGIKFKDFYKKGHEFIHPFGTTIDNAQFLKECIEKNVVPDDILSYKEIAMHFDVNEITNYFNNKFKEFKNLEIKRCTISNIDEIENKIIIDCTGFNKTLIDQAIQNNFIDITDKIPNNKAFVYRDNYDNDEQKVPYTTASAMEYGWIWEIPLKNKISYGYVHDKKYNVKSEFIEFLRTKFNHVDESKINEIDILTGRNKKHIVFYKEKIIIAVGLSSFFIEPLESTGLHLVKIGIETLGKYLNNEITNEEYDSIYNHEFDSILNFIILHYKYSLNSNDYWDSFKNLDVELYTKNSTFYEKSWKYILSGYDKIDFNHKLNSNNMLKLRKCKPYNNWASQF